MEEVDELELLVERVAGLDVGKAELVACVRVPHPSKPGRRMQEVRTPRERLEPGGIGEGPAAVGIAAAVLSSSVAVPEKVEVNVTASEITVKGPLGTLRQAMEPRVSVKKDGDKIVFAAVDETKEANALSGTMRNLLANMVTGVKTGFERRLNLVGVGYRAQAQGNKVNLSLGFSHPIVHSLPEGVKAETPTQTEIVIKGVDRQKVGQVAAEIRAYKPPEPYKGKGVRYAGEQIRRKVGKAGK